MSSPRRAVRAGAAAGEAAGWGSQQRSSQPEPGPRPRGRPGPHTPPATRRGAARTRSDAGGLQIALRPDGLKAANSPRTLSAHATWHLLQGRYGHHGASHQGHTVSPSSGCQQAPRGSRVGGHGTTPDSHADGEHFSVSAAHGCLTGDHAAQSFTTRVPRGEA